MRIFTKRLSALALAAGALAVTAAGASAATVGQNFTPNTGCFPTFSLIQTGVSGGNSYTVPVNGTLTSFTTSIFDTSATRGSVALVVERLVSGNTYTVVGVSAAHTLPATLPATGVTTAIAPIAVQAGDIVGPVLSGSSSGSTCARNAFALDTYGFVPVVVTTGSNVVNPPSSGYRFPITANLRVATTLTATGTTSPGYLLSATLRNSAGSGIGGMTITFSAGGNTVCTAVTNASGYASCSPGINDKVNIGAINNGGYDASFAGDANNFAPSSAHGLFTPRTLPAPTPAPPVNPPSGKLNF